MNFALAKLLKKGVLGSVLVFPRAVHAQQVASILVPPYHPMANQTYRQNVCNRQHMYARGEVKLRDALQGPQLNATIVEGLSVVGVASFEEFKNDKRANPSCSLKWYGRTIRHVPAGFAMASDVGAKCTSLVHDVINLHLVEMQLSNFIKRAWDEHLSRSRDISCGATKLLEEPSRQRSVPEMAGTFLVHLIFPCCSISVALASKYFSRVENEPSGGFDRRDDLSYVSSTRSIMTNDPDFGNEKAPRGGGVDPVFLENMLRQEFEMEQALQRRQDEMESKLQMQLQEIIMLLKNSDNCDVNGDSKSEDLGAYYKDSPTGILGLESKKKVDCNEDQPPEENKMSCSRNEIYDNV